MRLYPRMFRGSNLLKPGIAYSGDAARVQDEAGCVVMMVHRSNAVESAPRPALDLAAIEECARAARTAWVGSKLKPYFEALVRKFALGGPSEMEKYLAASQNLADLEERMRHYERRQLPYY